MRPGAATYPLGTTEPAAPGVLIEAGDVLPTVEPSPCSAAWLVALADTTAKPVTPESAPERSASGNGRSSSRGSRC